MVITIHIAAAACVLVAQTHCFYTVHVLQQEITYLKVENNYARQNLSYVGTLLMEHINVIKVTQDEQNELRNRLDQVTANMSDLMEDFVEWNEHLISQNSSLEDFSGYVPFEYFRDELGSLNSNLTIGFNGNFDVLNKSQQSQSQEIETLKESLSTIHANLTLAINSSTTVIWNTIHYIEVTLTDLATALQELRVQVTMASNKRTELFQRLERQKNETSELETSFQSSINTVIKTQSDFERRLQTLEGYHSGTIINRSNNILCVFTLLLLWKYI